MKSLELIDEFGISVVPPDQGFNENGVAVKSYGCREGDKPHAAGTEEPAHLAIWLEQAMRFQYLYLVTSVQRTVVGNGTKWHDDVVHYIIISVAIPGVLSK